MMIGLALFLAAISTGAFAQQSITYGRRFLVPFPDTSHVRTEIPNPMLPEARLILVSRSQAAVSIRGTGFQRNITLTPDSSRSVSLYDPLSRPDPIFTDTVFLPIRSAVEVTSDEPIAVVAYFATADGSEAYTALPVESWGREYRAVGRRNQIFVHIQGNEENLQIDDAPPQILVVASEDATSVTVTPVAGALGYTGGTYSLDAGEVLLVQTERPPSNLDTLTRDLTGARITATRPVGVISGNTRTEGALGGLSGTLTGNTLRNSAVEWLCPIEAHGTTFVYTPLARDGVKETPELVRVVATSPGTTTVVNSNGSYLRSIPEGSYADFNSLELASSGVTGPFALNTDRPAQVMVVSGGAVGHPAVDSLPTSYSALYTWSPSMAELPPHERWISSARFNSPDYPRNLRHVVSIAADSGATILLDGRRVSFDPDPVRGTPFRFARIELLPGDHTLHSLSGRFAAIAFGQARGYEAFEPLATRDDGDDPTEGIAHISKYVEAISASYAYPVPGVQSGTLPPDSLLLTRVEHCSDATVTATRTGELWMNGPLTVTIDPASRNLAVVIDTLHTRFIPSGYRIRFSPIDPSIDAAGGVLLENMIDSAWYIPYTYRARSIAIDPDPVEILGAAPGTPRTIPLTLTNIRSFVVTVLRARLRNGATGFVLSGGDVSRSLAAGGSYTLDLTFTGTAFSERYIDSLIIETDCRTFTVAVVAQTAPPDPAPVPLITGYDWGRRRVGTSHDTLSFISNAGDLEFRIATVEIVSDPAGAFALVAPDWRTIGAVPSGGRAAAGVRFTPPFAGDFQAEIVLTTTTGERASAMLTGSGADPGVIATDIDLGEICRTGRRSGSFVVRNSGTVPLRVYGVSAPLGNNLGLRFDTASLGLPRMLSAGESLSIGFDATPRRAGLWSDSVTVHTNSGNGDSIAVITAEVATCSEPGIEVDDHDFGNVLVTLSRDGFVTLRNRSATDVEVRSMAIIDDSEGSFALGSRALPFTVAAGASVRIDARFTPATIGFRSARIAFATDAGTIYSRLSGTGIKLLIPAFIRRDYHAEYGDTLTIAVELDSALEVDLDSIDVTIGFSSRLLAHLGPQRWSSAQGWESRGAAGPDSIRFHMGRTTRPSKGVLMAARFLARFAPEDSSELPLRIESHLPYVEFVERPGLFVADPICGLNERLYTLSEYRFVLEQSIPNPTAGAATIFFEIPFDNQTRLSLFDALGREVFILVDDMLAAGAYTFTLPSGAVPAGSYWYRLRSGEFTAARRMVVR